MLFFFSGVILDGDELADILKSSITSVVDRPAAHVHRSCSQPGYGRHGL